MSDNYEIGTGISREPRLAVLIDAENISASYCKAMMAEIARYGIPTIKRIYGDWARPNLSSWKQHLLDFGIVPVQQFGYTLGKNSTDSTLIIDAMDLLYQNKPDGFCLVSSDSDFTRLAQRLREAGKIVYGFGEEKTPNPFIASCDRFVYLEILTREYNREQRRLYDEEGGHEQSAEAKHGEADTTVAAAYQPAAGSVGSGARELDSRVLNFLRSSVSDLADETGGWAFLGDVGNLLVNKQPSFDPRNYGFQKLTPMFRAAGIFDIDERATGNRNVKHVYIRIKEGM
ncbi:MAG: NYN domain-containing protein [Clostridiaceae bacterium]|nr:NYN domain-containing protein [Clostridiaceae bacterium]